MGYEGTHPGVSKCVQDDIHRVATRWKHESGEKREERERDQHSILLRLAWRVDDWLVQPARERGLTVPVPPLPSVSALPPLPSHPAAEDVPYSRCLLLSECVEGIGRGRGWK